jgi:hypothetical protein
MFCVSGHDFSRAVKATAMRALAAEGCLLLLNSPFLRSLLICAGLFHLKRYVLQNSLPFHFKHYRIAGFQAGKRLP